MFDKVISNKARKKRKKKLIFIKLILNKSRTRVKKSLTSSLRAYKRIKFYSLK